MRRHYRNHATPFSRAQDTNHSNNAMNAVPSGSTSSAPRARQKRRVMTPTENAALAYSTGSITPGPLGKAYMPTAISAVTMHPRSPFSGPGGMLVSPRLSHGSHPTPPPLPSWSVSGEDDSEDGSEADSDELMDDDDELTGSSQGHHHQNHGLYRLQPVTRFKNGFSLPPPPPRHPHNAHHGHGYFHPQSDMRSSQSFSPASTMSTSELPPPSPTMSSERSSYTRLSSTPPPTRENIYAVARLIR